jgi:hypothetical protein
MKKIIFLNFDYKNFYIRNLAINLSKKSEVTVFTNKTINLGKKIKIIKNLDSDNNILSKIINLISNPYPSKKEIYYLKYSKKNIIIKFLYTLKILLGYAKILPREDFYYRIFYFNSNKYQVLLEKYDIAICDFRLNYNFNKKIVFEALKKKNLKLICFVYSWDNIYHSAVLRFANLLIIWSDFFTKLAIKKHQYIEDNIKFLKPLQFNHLIHNFKKKIYKEYILFAGAFSAFNKNNNNDTFFNEELLFIKDLSKLLFNLCPNFYILIRPYPGNKIKLYNQLKNITNIRISKYQSNFVDQKYIKNKNQEICNSKLVISSGSTINIESALLNKITLQLNLGFYNKNYLLFKEHMENINLLENKKYPNIIFDNISLNKILNEILLQKKYSKYKKYNNYIKKIFLQNNKDTYYDCINKI